LASKRPTTFGELKLSAYNNEFPRWRYARTVLLQLSDRWAGLPRMMTRFVQVLERTHLPCIEHYLRAGH
jgi:hypothetical protein